MEHFHKRSKRDFMGLFNAFILILTSGDYTIGISRFDLRRRDKDLTFIWNWFNGFQYWIEIRNRNPIGYGGRIILIV